ncbi:hypothetical protein ASPCAL05959 [Aspergillus calidoustus]|uniref:Fungal N-terminal domain-containing protein n=1 Tax=Aspergillus calidoustus TaxID=454130 RepID=A0A0U5FZR4_ASPCI|nr:hypothetical protein ASPCAL05959 [Aspergillus calidoustus]
MSPNPEILDIDTVSALAWDLYHSCHLLSPGAPDSFRQLVNELASLHGILGDLHDHLNSKSSFFTEVPETRARTLQGCVHACLDTLRRLKEVVSKYRSLGGDGGHIWHKVKWATQRNHIEQLKSRIMVHTANLHLYMSSIGNSSLKRLEGQIFASLEQDSPSDSRDIPQSPSDAGLPQAQTISEKHVGIDETDGPETERSPVSEAPRPRASFTIAQPRQSTSSASRVSSRSEESSSTIFTNNFFPSSPPRGTSLKSPAGPGYHLLEQYASSSRLGSSGSIHNDLPVGPKDDSLPNNQEGERRENEDVHAKQAVVSAMRHLHDMQLREQNLRSLRYEPRDSFHQPDAPVVAKFEASFNGEEHARRLSTTAWLRIAVWWLLKAGTTLANGDRPNLVSARGSMSPSSTSSTSSHQAYVDLLKASYILYDVVLKRQSPQSLMIDENRKLISDISEAIIFQQNLDLWEPVQPDENFCSSTEDQLYALENVRYTTVELEDAGAEEERVLLRTFVNAGIGGKKLRMRLKGAPYMLLLSTIDGESEPKVAICNQSGTLCLQRNLTHEDLAQLIRVSNTSLSGAPGAKISEPINLKFDSVTLSVSFQYSADLGQFINIPKAYFDAVWQREPVDSDQFSESVIFKTSVEVVEQLRAPIMKSMNPPMITRSCEVRVLERTFGEVWRSIRRMVISSSLAEKTPRCLEFFLPMSRVQVRRSEDSQSVQIKWSDTGQERSDKTDGCYNPLYSYVYDDNSPNIGLDIEFRSQQQAQKFEKVILTLTHKPTFSWSQPNSAGLVYEVADVALDQKQYKAVLLIESRLSFKHSSLYYLYRDVDYIYDSPNFHVKFPKIFYVDYISSHVEQLYRAANNVFFSHCEKKIASMEVVFNDEPVLHAFMSSLASTYELCFSRRAESMTTKKQSFLSSKKSTKGETEVQLWRKGHSIQLASRWTNHVADRWLTMSVPSGSSRNISRDSNRIEFPVTTYSRGAVLNLAVIAAGSPKDPRMSRREGPITISFPKPKDRDDFVAALDGGGHPSRKYGHSYDILSS